MAEPSDRLFLLRLLTQAVADAERLEAENRELRERDEANQRWWEELRGALGYAGHPANMVREVAVRLGRKSGDPS